MYSAFKASGPSEFSLLVPAWCLATGKGIPVGFLMFSLCLTESRCLRCSHLYLCILSPATEEPCLDISSLSQFSQSYSGCCSDIFIIGIISHLLDVDGNSHDQFLSPARHMSLPVEGSSVSTFCLYFVFLTLLQ